MKDAVITSSILILCIILLRWLCRGKISACLQYALWLVVVLRLMVPAVTLIFPNILPESEFSVMNAAEKAGEAAQDYIQLSGQIGQINIPAGTLPHIINEAYYDGPTSVFIAGRVGFIWIDFLKGIWYAGIVIIGIWMIAVNILFIRRLRSNRTKYEKEDYKLPIYFAKGLSSPCLYGFPGMQAVYLPEEITDDEEKVRHILAHEYCHYKHKDVFWAGLRCILLAVYWFNPLVWIAAVLSKRDCELACDESAIKMLGEEERIAYGKTLLSLITKRTKAADIVCTATTMTGTSKGIKERIKRIAEKPHRLAVILLPVLAAVGALIAFTFTQAKEAKADPEDAFIVEREGEQTVTTSCFQITFPETLADKIYCSTENDTDVIIYHKDSDNEIGRFCKMIYAAAASLSDEQEIIVIDDYGFNQMLQRYMSGEIETVTKHEYHSYYSYLDNETNTEYKSSSGAGPIPAPEDVDSEIVNLPYNENEDYFGEKIITEQVNENNSITSHDYKPVEYPNGAAAGTDSADTNTANTNEAVAGTDSAASANDEDIDSSIIYLPDEEITAVEIPHEWCYIYVPADNSDADEGIRGELSALNQELIKLCDSITILSMSIESMEEILDDIIENRDNDVNNTGSISKMSLIAQRLPPADGIRYSGLELSIDKEPYTATLKYNLLGNDLNQINNEPLFMDAVLMFALIENLDECNFQVSEDIGRRRSYSDIIVEDFESMTIYYERADMEELFGELYPCSASKEDLTNLYNRVLDYLNEN